MFDENKLYSTDIYGKQYMHPHAVVDYTSTCPVTEFADVFKFIDREYKCKADSFIDSQMTVAAMQMYSRSNNPEIKKHCLQLYGRILSTHEKINKEKSLKHQQNASKLRFYSTEALPGYLLNTCTLVPQSTIDVFKNMFKNRIMNRYAELATQPEELKMFREAFEKDKDTTEFLPPKSPVKQQNMEIPTIFKEELDCPFSLSSDDKNSKFILPELKETVSTRWKISSKDPNVLEAEGYDINGKCTFNLGINTQTTKYIYKGSNKVWSNHNNLKYSSLPDKSISCLKHNLMLAKTKALTRDNLKKGIQFKGDYGKTIRASRPRAHFAEIKINDAQGNTTAWFLVDTRTGEYRAKDLVTGKKYSNRVKDIDNRDGELPKEILLKMQQHVKKASNIAQSMIYNSGYLNSGTQR